MSLLDADLEEQLPHLEADLSTLRGAEIFLTGATGFVGSWLLETFAFANRRLALGMKATVLVRDLETARRNPLLASDDITLVRGDIREERGVARRFDAIVHAATPASAALNESDPLGMIDTIVRGGRSVLELARHSGRVPVLFTSSGAVYGAQAPDVVAVDEACATAPATTEPKNAYHEAKRLSELECAIYAARYGIRSKIARLFAFVGPYLPIDRHFAVGNFVADALAGRPVVVTGDGTTVRSYLYAADMATWLWRILVRGEVSRVYHVGSERAADLREVAEIVASSVTPQLGVEVRGRASPGVIANRYVPSTARTRTELDLAETVALPAAIDRTLAWHRARAAEPVRG